MKEQLIFLILQNDRDICKLKKKKKMNIVKFANINLD